jgi:hypothetical protein
VWRGAEPGLLQPGSYVLAVEFFWWAPKGGRELRAAFEAWALAAGAQGSPVRRAGKREQRPHGAHLPPARASPSAKRHSSRGSLNDRNGHAAILGAAAIGAGANIAASIVQRRRG